MSGATRGVVAAVCGLFAAAFAHSLLEGRVTVLAQALVCGAVAVAGATLVLALGRGRDASSDRR